MFLMLFIVTHSSGLFSVSLGKTPQDASPVTQMCTDAKTGRGEMSQQMAN